MIRLLRLIRVHPDAVEADLSRYHNGMDLRDLWRRDPAGRARLTLRQIYVRIKHLPLDSATANIESGNGWVLTHYLLADLYQSMAGQQHPHDPRVTRKPVDQSQLKAAKKRHDERRERLGITGSVLTPKIEATRTLVEEQGAP